MIDVVTDLTEDAFLGGQLLLKQKRSGHRAGHDAILLAAATDAHAGDRVVDLGAGVGTAGLALARRVAGIELCLVEIDLDLAELARANAAANAIGAEVIAPHRQGRLADNKTQDGQPLRRFKRRWKVERLFAWLYNFRRLVVRYEYHVENYVGFVQLACVVILLRHL